MSEPDIAAGDARFCVCGAERGHYGSERCKPKPEVTTTAAPLACECCEKPLPVGTPAKMDRETGVVICNECFADLTAVKS